MDNQINLTLENKKQQPDRASLQSGMAGVELLPVAAARRSSTVEGLAAQAARRARAAAKDNSTFLSSFVAGGPRSSESLAAETSSARLHSFGAGCASSP